ncbi:hypothetical protein E4T56_gene20884 [Termitomyces sp. T112]|nr:hypothetical protein E4T56_gene20884 [Termitomyces sp. T112]
MASTSASPGNSSPASAATSHHDSRATTLRCQCSANNCPILTTPSSNSGGCGSPIHEDPVLPDPACPTLINRSQNAQGDTHARSLHAPRPPPSPATPPIVSLSWPPPESSLLPPSPAVSLPPLWIMSPTVLGIPTNPAPPMPLLWPSALLYHSPTATHPSPSALCHNPPPLSGALSLMPPISSTTPPPNNEGMFCTPELGEYMWGPGGPAITPWPHGLLLGPTSGGGEALCLPLSCNATSPSLYPPCGGPTFSTGHPVLPSPSKSDPQPDTWAFQLLSS